MKTVHNYFSRGLVIFNYSIFVSKFVAMATRVVRGEIQMKPLDSTDPKIGRIGANSVQLSFTRTELYRFEISIGCNAKFCNF